jgi:hypothetical protein
MEFQPEFGDFDDEMPEDLSWQYDTCEQCGEASLEYQGEHYDDDKHLGSSYKCLECGHWQHFDNDE